MQLVPFAGWLIAKEFEEAGQTPGGLHLPDNVKNTENLAVVVSVGPPKEDNPPLDIKEGDLIAAVPRTGFPIKYRGELRVALSQDSVIAVLK